MLRAQGLVFGDNGMSLKQLFVQTFVPTCPESGQILSSLSYFWAPRPFRALLSTRVSPFLCSGPSQLSRFASGFQFIFWGFSSISSSLELSFKGICDILFSISSYFFKQPSIFLGNTSYWTSMNLSINKINKKVKLILLPNYVDWWAVIEKSTNVIDPNVYP